MAPFSWFRWLRSLCNFRGKTYRKPKRSLKLEYLETRLAPATYTWSGLGGNTNWNNPNNWVNHVAPTTTTSADSLVFNNTPAAALRTTNNNIATIDVGSITISGTGYTLNGMQLTLGNTITGGGTLNLAALAATIGLNVELGGSNANAKDYFSAGSGDTLTMTNAAHLAGAAELISNGVGTVVFTADNSTTFNGPIDILAGVLSITNANSLGNASATNKVTVETNATLQVDNSGGTITAPIKQTLLVNGVGSTNNGALLYKNGGLNTDATWSGPITMDSNATFGVTSFVGNLVTGSGEGTFTIANTISDNSTGHNLTKEGTGELIFTAANTYRGSTTINNGILDIENSKALGLGDGTAASGTVVNSTPLESGTLEIDGSTAPGGGITVSNELLTLNGAGYFNAALGIGTPDGGALDSFNGNNTWAGNIILGNPPATPGVFPTVVIGVGNTTTGVGHSTVITTLTVSGVVGVPDAQPGSIQSPNGAYPLQKVGVGTLIFTTANSYTGKTTISAGILEIEDSMALGTTLGTVAAPDVVVTKGGTLELADDARIQQNSPDSVTGFTNKLTVPYVISLNDLGSNAQGALFSLDGINTYAGQVILATIDVVPLAVLPLPLVPLAPNGDAIGVAPPAVSTGAPNNYDIPSSGYYDSNGNSAALDDSLTVNSISGGISDLGTVNPGSYAKLNKLGRGQLILPNANTYLGPTDIEMGWVTIGSDDALGVPDNTVALTAQPIVTVQLGAALHLLPLTGNITLTNPFSLTGHGITNNFYPLINQEGAIENLAGINTITGNIMLMGPVGVGVEQIYQANDPTSANYSNPLANNVASQLTLSGTQSGGALVQSVLLNGGFETGDFTDWVLSGNTGFTGVDNGLTGAAPGPHSGNFAAFLGPIGSDGFLTQNVPTTVGQQYVFSYFLESDGGTPNDFTATVNGNTVFTVTNLAAQPYTLYSFTFTATSASTAIQFAFRDDPGYLYLDDVSVVLVGVPTPGGIDKLGSGRLVITGPGIFIGNVNVEEGVLLDQNDTGLGTANMTVVNPGTALELGSTTVLQGGIQGGLQTATENVVLNGSGNTTFGDAAPLVVLPASNNTVPVGGIPNLLGGPLNDPIILTSDQWAGNVSLNTSFQVDFNGTLGGVAQPTLTSSTVSLLGTMPTITTVPTTIGGPSLVTGTTPNAAENITFGGTITGGSFTLTYNNLTTGVNVTTAPITWTDDAPTLAANIQAALVAALGTTAANLSVTPIDGTVNLAANTQLTVTGVVDDNAAITNFIGGSDLTIMGGGELVLSGANTYNGTTYVAQGVLTIENDQALGADGIADVQTITTTGSPSFTLTFNGQSTTSAATLTGNSAVDAANIQTALNNLSTIAGGAGSTDTAGFVTVTGDPTDSIFTVTFDGSLFGFAQPDLTFTPTAASGPGTVTIAKVETGAGATVVANGASLQLQGNITVAGEPLLMQGAGLAQSAAAPQQWFQVGPALAGVTAVDDVPTTQNVVLAGTSAHLFQFNPATGTWTQLLNTGNVAANQLNAVIDPTSPVGYDIYSIQGVVIPGGLVESSNDYATGANEIDFFGQHFAMDQVNPQRVVDYNPFAVGDMEETLEGTTVTAGVPPAGFMSLMLNPANPNLFSYMFGLANFQGPFDPDPNFPDVSDQGANSYVPGTIYVAQPTFVSPVNQVYVTKDSGLHWQNESAGLPANINIVQVVVDPRDQDNVYVIDGTDFGGNGAAAATAGDVVYQLNYNATSETYSWVNISAGLPDVPANALTIDPRTGALYVGTNDGIYTLQNGGSATSAATGNWTQLGVGLLSTPVAALSLDQTNNELTVGANLTGAITGATNASPIVITTASTAGLTTGELVTIAGVGGNTNANGVWSIDVLSNTTFSLTGSVGNALYTAGGTWTAQVDGVYQLSLDSPQANGGAFVAVSGQSSWTGPVVLAGATTLGANGSQAIQNGLTAAQLTITGTISDLNPGTNPLLTKTGDGNVVFAGANVYGGETLVSQGNLVVDNPNALSGTFTLVTSGAALELETSLLNKEPITLNGDGIPFDGHNTGALRSISNTNDYNGTITLASNSTIGVDTGSTLTIGDALGNGTITGAGFSLVKELTGTLNLADNNSYGGAGSFVLIDDPGNPPGTTYPSGTLVAQGILNVQSSGALGAAGNTTTVLDGALLQLEATQQVLTLTNAVAASTTFTLTFDGATTTPITYTGVAATDQAAIASALNSLATIGGLVGGLVSVLANGADNAFTVTFGANLVGSTLPLTANVTAGTATATVATGSINVPINENFRLTGTGIQNSGALQNVAGSNTINGNVTLAQDANFSPSTTPSTTVALGIGTDTESPSPNSGDSLTINGVISQAAGTTAGLNKVGPDLLILNPSGGNNTYGGVTTVSSGILRIQQSGALGTAGGVPTNGTVVLAGAALQLDGSVTALNVSGETLILNGTGSNSAGALENVAGSSNVWAGPIILGTGQNDSVGADTGTLLTVTGNVQDPVLQQFITLTGAVASTTTFTLTFNGATTAAIPYSGMAAADAAAVLAALNGLPTISSGGGFVSVTANAADTTYTVNFLGTLTGQTLPLLNAVVTTLPGVAAVTGSLGATPPANLVKSGNGTVDFASANSYTGTTFINAGALRIQNAGALGSTSIAEVQQVGLTGATAGTTQFKLSFNGVATAPILFTGTAANATAVQTALNALSTIKNSGGTVTNVTVSGTVFTVTFGGSLAGVDNVPLLGAAIVTAPGTASVSVATPGVGLTATVQTVSLTGAVANSTKFKLSFDGQTTATLTYTGNPTVDVPAVQNALNGLSALGGVGGAVSVAETGTVFTLTFLGNLVGTAQPLVTATIVGGPGITPASALVTAGAGGTIVNSTVVQTLTIPTGTAPFTLTFNGATTGTLTLTGSGSTDAAALAAALNGLSSIGGLTNPGSVTVSADPTDTLFTVTFGGSLAESFVTTPLTASAPGIVVAIPGATLALQSGITVSSEPLTLFGTGINGAGSLENVVPTGASNNSTWQGLITLAGNASVGADGSTTLTLNRPIVDNGSGFGLSKVGTGTVQETGSLSNTYTGLTNVANGTLLLNTTGGALAVPGNLTVGAGTGAGSAVVQELSSSSIAATATVAVTNAGVYDLGSNTVNPVQTLAALNVTDGVVNVPGTSSVLTTGALNMVGGALNLTGAASQLTLTGNVTAMSNGTGTATIEGSGTVLLAPTAAPTLVRVTAGTQPVDLAIGALLTGNSGLTLLGTGVLQLDNNEAYTGTTTLTGGTLLADGIPGTATDVVNAVTLNGGTLGGYGTVGQVTTTALGGVVSPGDFNPVNVANNTGVLTSNTTGLAGTETWNSATTFNATLNNDDPSVANPLPSALLTVNGNLNLNNANLTGTAAATIPLNNSATSLPTQFTIIQVPFGDQISGTFAVANVNDPMAYFFSGQKYDVTYNEGPGIPNSVVLTKTLSDLSLNVVSSSGPTATSVYGQDVSFALTVVPETGTAILPAGEPVTWTLTGQTTGLTVTETTFLSTTGQTTFDPQLDPNAVYSIPSDIATLPPDVYTVAVDYAGDNSFNPALGGLFFPGQTVNVNPTTVTVSTATSPVFGQPIALTATVNPRVTPSTPGAVFPSGLATFVIDPGTAQQQTFAGVTVSNGQASLTLNNLAAGPHTVAVSYVDTTDNFFGPGSTTGNFNLNVQQDTVVVTPTATPTSATLNTPVTFAATVQTASAGSTGTPTGTVKFYDGSVTPTHLLGTATLVFQSVNTAVATLPALSTLAVGNHNIIAVYSGDTNYRANQNTLPFTVAGAQASVSLTPLTRATFFGQTASFTATVSPVAAGSPTPTGTVTFVIDSGAQTVVQSLNGFGQTTLSINTLAASAQPHSISATYNGNSNYGSSSTTAAGTAYLTVSQDNSSTVVQASTNTAVFGQPVTLSATVTALAPGIGSPTGSVTFFSGPIVNNDILGTASLVNGTAVISPALTNLAVGSQTIFAEYNGDANFAVSTSPAFNETVNPDNTATALAVAPTTAVFGQSVTLTATVTAAAPGAGTPDGLVLFKDGATVLNPGGTLLNSNGQAPFTTQVPLTIGSHSFTASYSDTLDGNFLGSNSPATSFTVTPSGTTTQLQSSLMPSIFGQAVTFTATVTPSGSGSGTPTGSVTFLNGTQLLGTVALLNGTASFPTQTPLAAGSHSITAQYSGDQHFLTSTSAVLSQTVNLDSTTIGITSSAPSIGLGQSVTFTATVLAVTTNTTPTGSVTFIDGVVGTGTPLATVALVNGVATLSTTTLPRGTLTITAEYTGSANFLPHTASLTETVLSPSTTALTESVPSTTLGSPVTFTATVTATPPGAGTPMGTVQFFDGTTPLGGAVTLSGIVGNDTATLTTTALTAGTHTITAQYSGSTTFVMSTSSPPFNFVVGMGSTSTVLNVSPAASVAGQNVTLTATVSTMVSAGVAVPSGTVTFLDGTTTLGTGTVMSGGVATFSTMTLPVGSNSLTAVYSGDTNFATSTSPSATATVSQANTTTAVSAAPGSPDVFGTTVNLTAMVSDTTTNGGVPTGGVVTFTDGTLMLGTANLMNGTAVLPTMALPVGMNQTITATYGGTSSFGGSTGTLTNYTVSAAATGTTLGVVPASPSLFGQSVTLTATVSSTSGGTPTGNVTFMDGATTLGSGTLSGGVATLATTATQLAVGAHSFTAVYGTTASFAGSTSSATPYTVVKAGTSTVLSGFPSPSAAGSPVTFTATVTAATGASTAGGTVSFFLDGSGTAAGTGVVNASGVATFTTSALTAGSHTAVAVFGATSNFTASTSNTVTQVVQSGVATTTTVSGPTSGVFDQTLTFTITVTGASGAPSGNVQLIVDGTLQTATATLNTTTHQATLSLSTLSVGSHTVSAQYDGSGSFVPSVAATPVHVTVGTAGTTTTVTSSSPTSVINQSVTFTATVAPQAGGTPTGTVQFFDGTTALSGAVTLSGGVATFTTSSLAIATHNITAQYVPDAASSGKFAGSTSAVLTQTVTPVVVQLGSSLANNSTVSAGATFNLSVSAQNSAGQTVSSFSGTATITVLSMPAGAIVSGTLTVTFVNGVATFKGLKLSKVGTYMIEISVPGGPMLTLTINAAAGGRGVG